MGLRVSLLDPDFYRADPFPAYQRLRSEAPVYWHQERLVGARQIRRCAFRLDPPGAVHLDPRMSTQDVEIRGQKILEGQRVVMLYGSANRDDEIFGPDAESFDVTRDPNPHIQFGFGEHVCIGAALARLEARVMFEELTPLLASASLAGDVTHVRSTMIPGVRHMPGQFAAETATA